MRYYEKFRAILSYEAEMNERMKEEVKRINDKGERIFLENEFSQFVQLGMSSVNLKLPLNARRMFLVANGSVRYDSNYS